MPSTILIIAVTEKEGGKWLNYSDRLKYNIPIESDNFFSIKRELNACPFIKDYHSVLFIVPGYVNTPYRWDRKSDEITPYTEPNQKVEDFYEVDYNLLEEGMKKVRAAPPKPSLADKAKDIIYGDREKTYGHPATNLKRIAAYWSTHLGVSVTPVDVCDMMILMKLARLKNQPDHEDSLVDIHGYNMLKERIKEGGEKCQNEKSAPSAPTNTPAAATPTTSPIVSGEGTAAASVSSTNSGSPISAAATALSAETEKAFLAK